MCMDHQASAGDCPVQTEASHHHQRCVCDEAGATPCRTCFFTFDFVLSDRGILAREAADL